MTTAIQTTHLPTPEDLFWLLERSKHYNLANRADKAVELVCGGKVQRLPSAGQGRDRWLVQGGTSRYAVSVSDRVCGCKYHAYSAHKGGYAALCSHQLAAIFLSLWWSLGNQPPPAQRLRPLFAQAEESGILDWAVDVTFNHQVFDTAGRRVASAHQEILVGYRIAEHRWNELDHPIVIGGHTGDVTHPDLFNLFWDVVQASGWRIVQRLRKSDNGFWWRFVPTQAGASRIGVDDPWREAGRVAA